MVTIIVDTQDEYDEMMEYAEQYMCIKILKIPCDKCLGFKTHRCKDCIEQFHIKYGIRITYSTGQDKEG